MRAALKRADQWLNRNYNLHLELEADLRKLAKLQNRLGSGVAKYESNGTESHDPDAAKARHDDTLLEYSEQMARVEKEQHNLRLESLKTREAIDKLTDPAHRAIAIDRYLNYMKWEAIAKAEHISNAEVYRRKELMLEKMAEILKT